jgi:anthranilate phosphoribosyltransferase
MNKTREALAELAEGKDLEPELMRAAMNEIMAARPTRPRSAGC